MSEGTDFKRLIASLVLAALALALLLQTRRAELAGLRAREATLARRCDEACAADARRRAATDAAETRRSAGENEAARLMEELRRLRQRIADLETVGWWWSSGRLRGRFPRGVRAATAHPPAGSGRGRAFRPPTGPTST